MPQSRLIHFSACLATLFSLTHCGGNTASTVPCTPGEAGCQAAAGGSSSTGTATGGVTSVGGNSATSTTSVGGNSATNTTSVGGNSATSTTAKGGSSAAGGASAAGGTSAKGGASAVGGASAAGGTSAKGGASAVGGATSAGGTSAKASTSSVGGSSAPAGGTAATGGTTVKASTSPVGGSAPTGGTSSAATTAAATGGTTTDQSGVPLAKPGDKTSNSKEYLNLGEIRLLNNKWGSDELGCNTSLSVNVNSDKSVGWTFNRGNCGDNGSKPDFPELEFGINPFGATSSLRTSPAFSSTTLLPIQIKNITSASVVLDSFNLSIQNVQGARWDTAFEFWISRTDPVADANPEVYAELIAFYSWETDEKLWWKCDASGSVKAGDKSYDLCHQKDTWPTGGSTTWRFFHLNVQGGPMNSFSGKVDVKAFLDWMVQNYGVNKDFYLTRIEIGTEYDDFTAGTTTVKNATFEINGASRSIQTQ